MEASLPPSPLPHRWSVTSDSIAARIAGCLSAEELVLLKSVDPPEPAVCGPPFVDEHFAVACEALRRVRCVNLRQFVPAVVASGDTPQTDSQTLHNIDGSGGRLVGGAG